MVVGKLAEQSLPTPEMRGLNPNLSNKVFQIWGMALNRGSIRASHPAVLSSIPAVPEVSMMLLRCIDSASA